ncbi:MAG: PAS domain-containing protein [Deltaproteobacteria bacterium]|nr:PAS domain-containing protein [Deltaproteobacteria bacterium]
MVAAPAPPSEPRRETTAVPEAPAALVRDVDRDRAQVTVRLTWLLLFRAVVTTVLLATALVLRATSSDVLFGRAAVALFIVAALSYGAILAGALWLRLLGHRHVVAVAYSQLFFDAVVMTALVVITGGVESVFVFAFSLTVLNGAAVLGRRAALVLAAVAAALFTLVAGLEVAGVMLPWTVEAAPTVRQVLPAFLTNTASFVLVAILGGYLTEQLQKASERLDVTRARMARLEELYLAVLESLPSGVLTVDGAEQVVYVNEAGADILGRSPKELVGRRLDAAAPALSAAGVADNARFERTADVGDQPRTIGGTVARLVGLEGVAGRVIVYQDLTELRQLQLDVARAERLAELGRFAAGLAHEIRNPLAAMIGCLQLLRADAQTALRGAATGVDGAAESERMLGIVQREAERLSSLVTEFLTYARPAPPSVAAVPVLATAVETVATLKAGLDAGVTLTVDGAEVTAHCDADQLKQVLWNLVGNATQALRSVERTDKQVALHVEREGDDAVVTIDDNGPGVSPDIRGRIFEPFFTTRPEGTGLGLATVHQVLAQQGGRITLDDSPLGGARFTVRLPLERESGLDASAASGAR